MPTYSQATQPVAIHTPLEADAALLARLHGTETISELFHFTLDLLAESPLDFARLLGQSATVRLTIPGCPPRYINGILRSLEEGHTVQGPKGTVTFLRYQAELVPSLWLLSQRKQSRVYQDMAAPDIVLQILRDEWGLDVQPHLTGTYPARDYCVQFRETDLAFVRRLLEEEGICFYFQHEQSKHTLVLADSADGHPDLPEQASLIFDAAVGGRRPEGRITTWRKRQELRPAKYQLRDHCFQMPNSTLDSSTRILGHVQVGQVQHTLSLDPKQRSEIYEHPGGYGWRFDGVSTAGANQPAYVQNLFQDNERLAHIRMQEQATPAVMIQGESRCGHLLPGYTFTLTKHRNGDGEYLLTRVEHRIDLEAAYLSEATSGQRLYDNRFEAIPVAVPFRPPRNTPRPTIHGFQPALVVGPPGNDLFLDKYGRVKVKFFWDRNPKTGPQNSCWLRVAQVWAGNRWGAFFWPRVGHEVVVVFNEGNPDRPLVVGSVYNENNMPPFSLPDNRLLAGIKSFTSTGNVNAPADPLAHFNGIVFNDDRSKEQIELHGEKHIAFFGEHSHEHSIDGWHWQNVNGQHRLNVGAIPGSSGSGGGDSAWVKGGTPDFTYGGTLGTGGIGVSLNTVTGLSQSVVLGASFYLVVGQEFNLMMNPLGLALDLPMSLGAPSETVGMVLAGIANPLAAINGDIDLYFGTYAFVVYGQSISINRSGRTSLSSEINWKDDSGKLGPAQIWSLIAEILAEVFSLYTMIVTIIAATDAYSRTTLWDALEGVGEGLAEVLATVDILIGTIMQVTSAAKATAADALVEDDAGLQKLANALLRFLPN